MTSAMIGNRLKALRESRGLSQEDLSRTLGIESRQSLSQVEAGQRRLTADELVAAVEAFGVPLDYFTNPFLTVGEARFSWRRDDGVDAADLRDFERKAGEWIGAYRALRAATGSPLAPVVHRLGLTRDDSFEQAEASGEWIARNFDLGMVPADRLAQVMQDEFSTLVLMVEAGHGISGAACLIRDLGAVLVNRREIPGRRNFDLAHELFHILTWDAMPPEAIDDGKGATKSQRRVEQMANKFASAVLLPRYLLDTLDGPTGDPAWINATATRLGVTSIALKWRLVNLGRLGKHAVDDDLLRNNGGLPPRETVPPSLFGKPFMEILSAAIVKGEISVKRVATLLDLTVDNLGDLFEAHGIARPFDL